MCHCLEVDYALLQNSVQERNLTLVDVFEEWLELAQRADHSNTL